MKIITFLCHFCALLPRRSIPAFGQKKRLHSSLSFRRGPGGNRTRVRKPIHQGISHHSCLIKFPLLCGRQQPHSFSSFIIRLQTQSFACIVSRNHDAGYREYGYNRADEQPQAATATVLLSAFNFKFRFYRGPGHGWLPQLQNPRRNQYKP